MRLSEIATRLGLTHSGADVEITGVNTLDKAGPGDITFLANPKYVGAVKTTRAGAVIADAQHAALHPTVLVSRNVYMDLARVVHLFARPQGCMTGVSPLAFVHETAQVDPTATVYPFAFIGAEARIGASAAVFPGCYVGERCTVGEGCTLYPNAVLMADTTLGRGVILHAGSVLGADGFGYAHDGGMSMKIPQIGRVRIGDDVEIGANAAVDRAVLDVTSVGDGTKLDNMVQIGHNCRLGKGCFLAAQTGIGGSTKLGDHVIMGGQSGTNDNIEVGDGCMIGGQSGVQQSLPPGSQVSGTFAMDYRSYLKVQARLPQLPELFGRIRRLEKALARLTPDRGEE